MTAQERTELQELTAEVGRLANEQKAMNEKVSDLLIGRTANCATESGRIAALEKAQEKTEKDLALVWSRLWWIAAIVLGSSSISSALITYLMRK